MVILVVGDCHSPQDTADHNRPTGTDKLIEPIIKKLATPGHHRSHLCQRTLQNTTGQWVVKHTGFIGPHILRKDAVCGL